MSSELEKRLRAEQATEWLMRLEKASPQDRVEFWKWVVESPLHVREILVSKAAQTMFVHLFRDCGIDSKTFATSASNVREIGSGERVSSDPEELPAAAAPAKTAAYRAAHRSVWKVAAAVTFVSVLTLMTVGVEVRTDLAIDTGPGERQAMLLADGTAVYAASRTRVSTSFSERQRIVRLERGEALFKVAKDRARPFLVETYRATVRAVGTEFVVNRVDPDADVVTVKEGVVAVLRRRAGRAAVNEAGRHAILKAGEQVRVMRSAALNVERAHVQKELDSINGWLQFDRETVAQAVRQFNFRNRTQIRISSKEFGREPLRGSFEAEEPGKFVAFLERQKRVSVIDDKRGVLLLMPYAPGRAAAVE